MGAYIVRQLASKVVVLLGITIITFILIDAIPADPARLILGQHASVAAVKALRIQLGLNLPLPIRYLHYLGSLLHGNLGYSYVFNMPVTTMIMQRMGASAWLALGCWIAEIIIGVPLGIFTARRAHGPLDYFISALALVGISLPVFWLGLILLYWLGYIHQIFPLGGIGGIRYLVLPALTYGITGAAYYQRLLRSSMLEVMGLDYVRTARAKGASDNRVVWRHVVRNALIPVMTYAGIDIGYLMTGVVLIEATFNWNGLGLMAYTAISNDDVPVIMGTVLLIAVFVVVFTLLVDIVYSFLDPRIRYD